MQVKLSKGVLWIDEKLGWNSEYREAHQHEIVPALVKIIDEMQDKIWELEKGVAACLAVSTQTKRRR